MENTNNSPEELNPTNGNENNDNIQNNSEENIQDANTEKEPSIHVPGMIERMEEEGAKKIAQESEQTDDKANKTRKRDPRVWEENVEADENHSEENQEQEDPETNAKGKKRYNKRNNKRIANLKRTKVQKEKKLARLISERNTKKADIDRGYLIVHLNDDESDTEHSKHVRLNGADKEVIKAVIAEREDEIFDLNEEIEKIDADLLALATVRKSSARDRLGKKKQTKKEDDLVDRVGRELNKASNNGDEKIISEIQQQVQSGHNNDAYYSLKAFLSEQVKTVAKKLDKSEQLEKKVLDRVLENISKAQS